MLTNVISVMINGKITVGCMFDEGGLSWVPFVPVPAYTSILLALVLGTLWFRDINGI